MSERSVSWTETHPTRTVALNVGGRYLTLATELLLGLVMLPFNMRYLGMSEYGVWMLAASIVSYFPISTWATGSRWSASSPATGRSETSRRSTRSPARRSSCSPEWA